MLFQLNADVCMHADCAWLERLFFTGKPSQYVTSNPCQLSLATPPWVGAMSISESWDINKHTVQYTSPVSVSCSLNRIWLRVKKTEISATLWALKLGKYFRF